MARKGREKEKNIKWKIKLSDLSLRNEWMYI